MCAKSLFSFLIIIAFLSSQLLFSQVIDYKTVISIESDQKKTTTSMLIQVNSAEERWLGEISIPYQEGNEPKIQQAIILDKNGNEVRSLKKKEITERSNISSISFYENDLSKDFHLIWNEYPYRIKYSYSITEDNFVYVARWPAMFYSNVTHLNSSLQVTIPKEYDFFKKQYGELKYSSTESLESITHKWNANFIPLEQNVKSPPFMELIPLVVVVPKKFNYTNKGSFESWDSYGKWHFEINFNKDELPNDEKNRVDKLIKGLNDQKEIIEVLYKYMQSRTKYVNVSIDEGGLVPYTASYVCYNGYGDCKALTIYMKALLRYANIESNYCLVNAGIKAAKIDPEIPCQQFNHVILGIPLEGDTIWLENTNQDIPAGYLGPFTQNRYVLWIKKEGSSLVKTPKLDPEDVKEIRKINYQIDAQDIAHFSFTGTFKGEYFEYFNSLNKKEETEELYGHLKKTVIRKDIKIDKSNVLYSNDQPFSISIELEGKSTNLIRKVGSFKVISPITINVPDFEKPSQRKFPVEIRYPTYKIDSISFTFSSSFDLDAMQLPKPFKIIKKFGKYEVAYHLIDKNTILFVRVYQLNDGKYPMNEYPEFYAFIQAINANQKKSSIIINP